LPAKPFLNMGAAIKLDAFDFKNPLSLPTYFAATQEFFNFILGFENEDLLKELISKLVKTLVTLSSQKQPLEPLQRIALVEAIYLIIYLFDVAVNSSDYKPIKALLLAIPNNSMLDLAFGMQIILKVLQRGLLPNT
jgi:hypothetical protein